MFVSIYFSAVKPVRVKILTANDLLTAGQPVPLRCDSWGSYPAAKITWLLDGEPIRNAEVTVHSDREVGIPQRICVRTFSHIFHNAYVCACVHIHSFHKYLFPVSVYA